MPDHNAITPDLVEAYGLCKRKAFLLLRGDRGDATHQYVSTLERVSPCALAKVSCRFPSCCSVGGTARLVLLPYESHGYRARESVLHVLAEMFEWTDKYIKNRTPPAPR
jgi:hypothetical protein